jgi:hypothetical protein
MKKMWVEINYILIIKNKLWACPRQISLIIKNENQQLTRSGYPLQVLLRPGFPLLSLTQNKIATKALRHEGHQLKTTTTGQLKTDN